MNKKTSIVLASLTAAVVAAGCASAPSVAELNALTDQIVKASFRDQGPVKVERITATDATNRACSEADVAGKPLDEKTAKALEEANLKTIKWPSDGQFIGDWKQGEAIAQSGRGLTWTDDAKTANGGNCYNCHQISKEEISYGTIGPSLYNYGKIRGVSDPASPASKAIVEYTWGKIWNAKAYNACSNMPRAGHMGILNESQVRHIVGLLLDPKSPVNQ
ncbi:sulfur oxidation c-type cytochrome SoxX [Limnohabitans sp. 2KL-1]|jgi:sulfur-oxidizing protein SoxX|uniref:sulfur oxidation c-type cytochrome SoxX n=1 Tax=Limnohabitans sp. 2KL-1 TaxID=1100699 RepID=UPI000D3D97CB|nr:sulfur oxidation c-type cytochrome SoxX [Limnohabitans sp. 2KL-1]PUE50944.1 sulfur oxidation c-type cytochrome SoxX [Limnohabitans sp. 2KL-1]